jgi:DNA-binding NtrC family response regulator
MPLVIVRPGEYATFNFLVAAFADDPDLRVIWDRRQRERRQGREDASLERRTRERRQPKTSTLQQLKYVVADATSERLQVPSYERPLTSLHTFSDIEDSVQCAVKSDAPVLISNGAASDRMRLAAAIHRRSRRQGGPFVVHDVRSGDVAFNDQLTASAEGGTLFVVEIAALDYRMQCALLKWLDTRGDASASSRLPRVIAGTAEQLFARVTEGNFDGTLFYRLNTVHLVLPQESSNAHADKTNNLNSAL